MSSFFFCLASLILLSLSYTSCKLKIHLSFFYKSVESTNKNRGGERNSASHFLSVHRFNKDLRWEFLKCKKSFGNKFRNFRNVHRNFRYDKEMYLIFCRWLSPMCCLSLRWMSAKQSSSNLLSSILSAGFVDVMFSWPNQAICGNVFFRFQVQSHKVITFKRPAPI